MTRSGVYLIRNQHTETCYVGASLAVRERWNQHRSDLRCRRHTNPRLQEDWVVYGEYAFMFTLLEAVTSRAALSERENIWLVTLRAQGCSLYNAPGPAWGQCWERSRHRRWVWRQSYPGDEDVRNVLAAASRRLWMQRLVDTLQVRRVLALMGDGVAPEDALRQMELVRG